MLNGFKWIRWSILLGEFGCVFPVLVMIMKVRVPYYNSKIYETDQDWILVFILTLEKFRQE